MADFVVAEAWVVGAAEAVAVDCALSVPAASTNTPAKANCFSIRILQESPFDATSPLLDTGVLQARCHLKLCDEARIIPVSGVFQ